MCTTRQTPHASPELNVVENLRLKFLFHKVRTLSRSKFMQRSVEMETDKKSFLQIVKICDHRRKATKVQNPIDNHM